MLRDERIPRSTYYSVAKQLGIQGGDISEAIWTLMAERRELNRQVQFMRRDLLILREALGKPWKR